MSSIGKVFDGTYTWDGMVFNMPIFAGDAEQAWAKLRMLCAGFSQPIRGGAYLPFEPLEVTQI